jgi:coenzyme F420-reducing hydrogenase beta subunit
MKKQFLSFRKRVYLSISLVCGHFPTHRAYDYSFGRMRIKREEVQNIYNRGEGWPGYFRIQLKDGTIRSVPYGNSLSWGMVFASPLFTPKACHICPDPGGYAADIMVCDAWLPEFKENKEGVNLILAQTDIGRKLVKKVAESGEILLESRSVDDFVLANKRVFVTKIRNHDIALKSLFGKKAKFLHKNITGDFHASGPLLRIRLWCYYLHVKMALFFKLDRIVGMLPKAFLIYWKAITLLKR